MRQFLLYAICVEAFVLSADANAQDHRRTAVSVAIGPAFPMSPEKFTDYWSVGLGIKGGIEKPLTPTARLTFDVDLSRFPLNSEKLRRDLNLAGSLGGGYTLTACFAANALFYLDQAPGKDPCPYARIGLGFFHISIAEARLTLGNPRGLSISENDNTIMVQGGVGIEIASSREHKFFIDAGLVFAATRDDPTLFIPVRVGLRTR